MADLKKRFVGEIRKNLQQELKLKNVLAVPRVVKIVVNIGVGTAKDDAKILASYRDDLQTITGQRPALRLAKKAEAGFKIKAGDPVGLMVTLRGEKMWNFLEKMAGVVLARVRDFRGLPLSGFDGHGNYNLGIADHTVFPEINPNKVDKIKSLGVNICTDAGSDRAAGLLLRRLGLPLSREENG